MEKFATGYEIYYRLACERKSVSRNINPINGKTSIYIEPINF